MTQLDGPRASLELTHVVYDDTSLFSFFLALISLSPILLMACYAALAIQSREFLIIVMWAGQLAGEALSWVIKRIVKQDRPIRSIGNGYGFPSSHSQFMAYFSCFLMCHIYLRHRFSSSGFVVLDTIWRMSVYIGLLAWIGIVAYSRYSLGYHDANQILWGIGIGAPLGILTYVCADLIPRRHPSSVLGKIKLFSLSNPISTWLQIRDGWGVWADGGREGEWLRWRTEWEKQRLVESNRSR